jgi:hypothetical protein
MSKDEQPVFSRSLTAHYAAVAIVNTAKSMHILDAPMRTAPELAEMEKFLFISLFDAIRTHEGLAENGLDPDEVAAMFNFVYVRSAEAVTAFLSGNGKFEFDATGLFGGPAPFYADEKISAKLKEFPEFPSECAVSFLSYADTLSDGTDRLLTLFEAMKWCFRIGCHIGLA